nr:immunoglobulin light chain junction region [Macaca mulatta]MOV79391.1 immunoglobulin light chain junction region [Macaca mulatta]MOV80955.1 immunoglobulin light chain junction region [Macaca mulatta]MOV81920.1 immunoglobulin light chain junction region [Macaca mulatta]MOV82052.1 immunoglobulin light chain junction region [Macaca mulatta]
CQQYNSDWRTF